MKIVLYIIITILIIYSVIITILFTLKYNQKIIGGVHSDEIKINKSESYKLNYKNTDIFNPDNHFKDMLTLLCSQKLRKNSKYEKLYYNNSTNIKYSDSIINEEFNNKLFSIYKLKTPLSFKPDFIIENKNKIIIVEADEGGDFHSSTNNINYVKKRLYYDKLINTTIHNKPIVIFRFTYPPKLDTTKNNIINNSFTGKLNIQIIKIINYIVLTSTIISCYILYKYKENEYNPVLKICSDEINNLYNIPLNIIYDDYNKYKIKSIPEDELNNTKLIYNINNKSIGGNNEYSEEESSDFDLEEWNRTSEINFEKYNEQFYEENKELRELRLILENKFLEYYGNNTFHYNMLEIILNLFHIIPSETFSESFNETDMNIIDTMIDDFMYYINDNYDKANYDQFANHFRYYYETFNKYDKLNEKLIYINIFVMCIINFQCLNLVFDKNNKTIIISDIYDIDYNQLYNEEIDEFIINNSSLIIPELLYLYKNPFYDNFQKYLNFETYNIETVYLRYFLDYYNN